MPARFGLVAMLRDQPDSIEAYERYHSQIWPEVLADGRTSGVIRTTIFRDGLRLFMVMDGEDGFDIAGFGSGPVSPRTDEWQTIMDGLLADQPDLSPGRKWRPIGTVCDAE